MDLNAQSHFMYGSMKAAINEVYNENTATYRTERDIVLDSVADSEPWQGNEFIRKLVPNFDSIKVVLLSSARDYSFNDVNKNLRANDGPIGLILLGSFDRRTKPALIVLTTENVIYALDPDFQPNIDLLKGKLDDRSLEFWTTNGLRESECLSHKHAINLLECESKVKCCTGVHLHLMTRMSVSTLPARLMYPRTARNECNKRPRIERFEKLVDIWLDINQHEIYYDRSAIPHLASRPLNVTAINIIKKRCILVRPLAKALNRACWLETRAMLKNTFYRLLDCDSKTEELVRDEMHKCQANKEVDIGYYLHLDSGSC